MGRRLWACIKRQKCISVDVRKAPKGIWEHTNNSAFFSNYFLLSKSHNITTCVFTMQNMVRCSYGDSYSNWKVARMKVFTWSASELEVSSPPDFLPWCIRCCNEDVDHHPVTHVKAVLHCPGEGENKSAGRSEYHWFFLTRLRIQGKYI